MKKESSELKSLPIKELRQEIRKVIARLKDLGFPITRLDSFVSATLYRRDSLFHESTQGKSIGDEERQRLWQEHVTQYDGLSGVNLTETMRYQYDRASRENKLNRSPFPNNDSQEYEDIRQAMQSLGIYLKELEARSPTFEFYQESQKILSTTPEEIVADYAHKIIAQYERETPDEEKAGEITFYLEWMRTHLQKAILNGDEFPADKLERINDLEATAINLEREKKFVELFTLVREQLALVISLE